jgi:crotonobetainyl-CoA:carnitine CoA-transferase CaiB-like acyl-CoA transferase
VALVVDLTGLSAVYATRLLVEAGHRVVRVEPAAGDEVRRAGPFLGDRFDLEHGAYHQFMNAGKESFTLNTLADGGSDVLLALLRIADVAIVTRPLDLDPARVLELNPRLALVEVDDVVNELCAYARSGLLSLTGHPGKTPVLLGGHAALSAIGLYVAVAASASLMQAQLRGSGGRTAVSAMAALEGLTEQAALVYYTTGKAPGRRGIRGAITAVSGAFPCADGYWMISLPHTRDAWTRLIEWVGDPELAADPSLAEPDQQTAKRDFILDRLFAWSRRHTKDELVRQAQERHIPSAPVSTTSDLVRDPQLLARGFLREIDHPDFGPMFFPSGAVTHVGKPPQPAPALGRDTQAILSELGYSEPERRALLENGIV